MTADQKSATMPRGEKRGKKKVVCMRVFYNESFDEVERKIGVKLSTSKAIWQETKDSEDFHEILACIKPKEVFGWHTKVIDGRSELAAIRARLYDEKDNTFE